MPAPKNSLVKTAEKPKFLDYVSKPDITARINQMIGSKDGPRFISAVTSAVTATPALQECDYGSILSCALLGEGLKLSPSPQLGQYYMVPFDDKKAGIKKAQFILGYKGYIQLAIRSGYYKKINVLAIKEGELVSFDPLNEEIEVRLIEDEEAREAAPTIGYYAMFEYTNGFRKAMYWSRKKMEVHADKFSKAFSLSAYRNMQAGKIPATDMWKYSSFWYKDFDGMAYKTMLRQIISKWGIMSIDMQDAMEKDAADDYATDTTEYVTDAPAAEPTPVAVFVPEEVTVTPTGDEISEADPFFMQ